MISVTLQCFAQIREWTGRDSLTLELPEPVAVEQLVKHLAARGLWKAPDVLPPLRYAVNQEFVSGTYRVQAGDEVCLIPPVAGG